MSGWLKWWGSGDDRRVGENLMWNQQIQDMKPNGSLQQWWTEYRNQQIVGTGNVHPWNTLQTFMSKSKCLRGTVSKHSTQSVLYRKQTYIPTRNVSWVWKKVLGEKKPAWESQEKSCRIVMKKITEYKETCLYSNMSNKRWDSVWRHRNYTSREEHGLKWRRRERA